MPYQVTTKIRIQSEPDYFYTVEDTDELTGSPGCTISSWNISTGVNLKECKGQSVTMTKEDALQIAESIFKLFK